MNFSEALVKIEATQEYNDSKSAQVGPFRIQRGENPLKPYYQPIQVDWTNFENAKYAAFILYNEKKLMNLSNSQMWAMCKEMSQSIRTRNFRQCKAHHSKLISQFSTIPRILDYLQISIPNFDKLLTIERENLQISYASQKSPISVNYDQKSSFGTIELSKMPNQKENAYKTSEEYPPQDKNCFNDQSRWFLQNNYPPFSAMRRLQKTTQEQWVQCHKLFVQWTIKMKQLMVLQLQN